MMSDALNREWGNASNGESGEVGGRPQGSPPGIHSTPALTMNEGSASSVFAVGVDGGGSKTLAVVVDVEGNERGRGVAGSSNHTGVGIEQAVQHIYSAVEDAARQAGCTLPLQSSWFGLAGVDRPGDYDLLLPYLLSLAQSVHLTNDAELVLSGLPDAVGIALIAGTGSIALGCDTRGTKVRSGGWGHIIGDEGSGYELGCRCLHAVARATDGRGQATMLVEMLLRYWRLDVASDMIGKVYDDPDKATIAALSALVFAAARDGDEVACGIVEDAVRELALVTVAVKNRLDFTGGQVGLALGGGLLLHETDFRTKVISAINAHMSLGDVALVEEPALSGARASIIGNREGREKGKHHEQLYGWHDAGGADWADVDGGFCGDDGIAGSD
jgi:N-acetylglucosamine kinase-like BadF-type ATPase